MTCIVGLIHEGSVWIGGDTLGSTAEDKHHRKDVKVFQKNDYLIGFTTSYRMGQVLQYAFTPPEPPDEDEELHGFMVTAFVDALRAIFKEKGFATKHEEQESGGTFLVGVKGRLFRIESDYQVAEPRDDYDAVGCGQRWASGAMFATAGMEPKKRILLALKAAEHSSTGVQGPFTILKAQ